MNCWAVLLAAGCSSRMGQPKQLLPWQGRTLLEHCLESYLGLSGVVVVLGYGHTELNSLLADRPVTVVVNPAWHEGMGGSLAAGVKALPSSCSQVVVGLADMPLVSKNLVEAVAHHPGKLVYPVFEGRRGHPVKFARCFFCELAALTGAHGARSLLKAHSGVALEWSNDACLRDLDRPEDLETFL